MFASESFGVVSESGGNDVAGRSVRHIEDGAVSDDDGVADPAGEPSADGEATDVPDDDGGGPAPGVSAGEEGGPGRL